MYIANQIGIEKAKYLQRPSRMRASSCSRSADVKRILLKVREIDLRHGVSPSQKKGAPSTVSSM